MKTSGVDRSRDIASARRKAAKGGDGRGLFAALLHGTEAADNPLPAASSSSLAVDGLLGLQEVPSATEGPARGKRQQHGTDILDAIDALRMDILAGAVPLARLAQIVALLQKRPPRSDDAVLEAVLDEIELRAAVELAKRTGRADGGEDFPRPNDLTIESTG